MDPRGEAREIDWKAMEAFLQRRNASLRRRPLPYAAFIAMTTGLVAWASDGDLLVTGGVLAFSILVGMASFAANRGRVAEAAGGLPEDRQELLRRFRRELERERKKAVVLRILLPVVAAAAFVASAYALRNGQPRAAVAGVLNGMFVTAIAALMHRNLGVVRAALSRIAAL